jgi:hypothetical protein
MDQIHQTKTPIDEIIAAYIVYDLTILHTQDPTLSETEAYAKKVLAKIQQDSKSDIKSKDSKMPQGGEAYQDGKKRLDQIKKLRGKLADGKRDHFKKGSTWGVLYIIGALGLIFLMFLVFQKKIFRKDRFMDYLEEVSKTKAEIMRNKDLLRADKAKLKRLKSEVSELKEEMEVGDDAFEKLLDKNLREKFERDAGKAEESKKMK